MSYTAKAWEPFENPIGLDGFSFIEFATPNPTQLIAAFKGFGFRCQARNQDQTISLYTQGNVNLIINNDSRSYAKAFGNRHGSVVSAMGWRVKDADFAFHEVVRLGAKPFEDSKSGLGLPAIYGVGDILIYFVDEEGEKRLYNQFLTANPDYLESNLAGIEFIDHLDHLVHRGNLQYWVEFYEKLFNFKYVKYYDIQVEITGSIFKVMASPCGKMIIPIGESARGKSWVTEYLDKVGNEGINHVAFHTANLCNAIEYMRSQGQTFLSINDQYYDSVEKQIFQHGENLERLRKNQILIDDNDQGYLLQIFTTKDPGIEPLFFEFIYRHDFLGFGDKNVKTLLAALERDQVKRGYLKDTETYAGV